MPTFNEQVNPTNLAYLKKLSDYEIEQLLLDNKEDKDQDGKSYNFSRITKGVKSMGVQKVVKYKYARGRKEGRIYGTTFSIQALPNNIRTFLTNGIYKDYDMVNAHFQILLKLCVKHQLTHKYIKMYVDNRKEVLENNDATKLDMLVLMNTDKPKTKTSYLKSLANEIQSARHELLEIYKPTTSNTRNPLSSQLNRIMTDVENQTLQKVIHYFKLKECVPMFDGFMCREDISLDDLKKITGYDWTLKEHEDTIEIDEEVMERKATDYQSIKEEFETKNFMCRQPLCFYRLIDNDWVETNRQDMELDTMELQADGKPFFKRWLMDKDKRKYERVIWCPKDETVIDGKFNTFESFTYTKKDTHCSVEAKELFDTLLSMLTNHIESQTLLLRNYLAHLIQKPYDNPEVAMVFKGLEGSGKDTLLYIIDKLLGNDYVYCEQDINNILGNFNGIRSKKLVVGLNEMDGKDGVKFREALKHSITAKTLLINEKYGKQRTEENYTRFFIFSNGLTPIQVGAGLARRFAVFDTSSERCGVKHKSWWSHFYNVMNKGESLQTIFNYLSFIDIDGWNAGEHVETASKTKMALVNNNPVYSYLQNALDDLDSHSCLTRITIKGKPYVFGHWGAIKTNFELSDFSDNPIKTLHFKKLLLSLDGVECKRRGKIEGMCLDADRVSEELRLRLVKVEEL